MMPKLSEFANFVAEEMNKTARYPVAIHVSSRGKEVHYVIRTMIQIKVSSKELGMHEIDIVEFRTRKTFSLTKPQSLINGVEVYFVLYQPGLQRSFVLKSLSKKSASWVVQEIFKREPNLQKSILEVISESLDTDPKDLSGGEKWKKRS